MAVEIPNAELAGRSHTSDAKLLRRLDWRFLLPEPRIDSVGYVGPGKDSLLPALNCVAGSVAMVLENTGTPSPDREGTLCDVVVVQSSSLYYLEQGITFLKPNGWLYWEVDRRQPDSRERIVNSSSGRPLKNPKELIKVLQRWGFYEEELCWHRPNFNACKEFVSLRDEVSLGFLLSQFVETSLPRWAPRVAWNLVMQGFFPSIFRCLSVVARKGLSEG